MNRKRELRVTLPLAPAAVLMIHEECLRHVSLKTGGLLGGHVRAGDPHAPDVLVATRPNPKSADGPRRFVPDVAHGGARLQALRQSDPFLTHVGSWRQHVGAAPRPRMSDLIKGQEYLADSEFGSESFVLLIAHGRPTRLRAFTLRKGEGRFREVSLKVAPLATPALPGSR